MNYIFEIIELNKFTNDLRTLYKNYFNKWVEYGGDPLTALHASTISTNEKVISDITKIHYSAFKVKTIKKIPLTSSGKINYSKL